MAICKNIVQSRSHAVDRNRVDMTWERLQEQALQAYRTGHAAQARANWARAQEIAEHHFERGDPRLAASYTNHGFALLRQGHIHQANSAFQQAVVAWEDSWCWVPWMAPSSAPGEPQAAPYDRETQTAFYALIEQGKAITETIAREHRLPAAVGDDWAIVKPKGMNDIRRLYAAVFLMPMARSAETRSGPKFRAA